ncbi:MAG: histidine kinase N-terminal domain-containing protein [Actinomycetota bacterium]|nr:histidine kinase N-terminal domain-containing protein [Actinomycetota bacterium]
MGTVQELAEERTDLHPEEVDRLQQIIGAWGLIADLSLSDLVLWVPTWNNAGALAAALVRPTTASTTVEEDLVGRFVPRGRLPEIDQALHFGRAVGNAFPIKSSHEPDGRVIGVIVRSSSPASRVAGHLEEVYLRCSEDLLHMMVAGDFPPPEFVGETSESPRVGDGLVRLNGEGTVTYASPNAMSVLRRLGLAADLVGADLASLLVRLSHRHGPMDQNLALIAGGRIAGQSEVENARAVALVHGIPLSALGREPGALILVRDITDVRRRERALMSADTTIREIHHRVKNNLQTVAALLRMQGRRAQSEETRLALGEAELRVAAIAVVHETLSRQIDETVEFDEVTDRIIQLVRELAPALGGTTSPAIQRTGSAGLLGAEVAMPLAMCVSELLQNAVEHAQASVIEVRVRREPDALVTCVCDDGLGMPADLAETGDVAGGLGLQIVHSLVGELQGSVEISVDFGTTVMITVPLDEESLD